MLIPNRFFSPFKLFLHRESHTALMLNPKVLTTFTRSLLTDGYVEHLGHKDPSDGRWRMLKIARRFPVAPVRDYLDFLRRPDDYQIHAFVRNPYGRLASAWKNKFVDGHNKTPDGRDSGYPRSIRAQHLKKLRHFAKAQGLAGARPGELVPFETFLRYAAATPEHKRDHHWAPQTKVLMCDQLRYARIYRIETELAEGFSQVMGRIGLPVPWVVSRLGTQRNPSRTKGASYTPELAVLARPLCGDDLAAFGYDSESWKAY